MILIDTFIMRKLVWRNAFFSQQLISSFMPSLTKSVIWNVESFLSYVTHISLHKIINIYWISTKIILFFKVLPEYLQT